MSHNYAILSSVTGIGLIVAMFVPLPEKMPDNVLLYRSLSEKVYYAPSCVGGRTDLVPSYRREVVRLKLKPESACKRSGALRGVRHMLIEKIMRRPSKWDRLVKSAPKPISPLKSRWNSDGTWRW